MPTEKLAAAPRSSSVFLKGLLTEASDAATVASTFCVEIAEHVVSFCFDPTNRPMGKAVRLDPQTGSLAPSKGLVPLAQLPVGHGEEIRIDGVAALRF